MNTCAHDLADTVRSYLLELAAGGIPDQRDILDRAVVVLHVAGAPRVPVAIPRCPHRILVIGYGDIPAEWQLPDDGVVVDARRNVIGWQGLTTAVRDLGEWLAGGGAALVF